MPDDNVITDADIRAVPVNYNDLRATGIILGTLYQHGGLTRFGVNQYGFGNIADPATLDDLLDTLSGADFGLILLNVDSFTITDLGTAWLLNYWREEGRGDKLENIAFTALYDGFWLETPDSRYTLVTRIPNSNHGDGFTVWNRTPVSMSEMKLVFEKAERDIGRRLTIRTRRLPEHPFVI